MQSPDDSRAEPFASDTTVSSIHTSVDPEELALNSNTVKTPSPAGIVLPVKEKPITIPKMVKINLKQ